MKSVLVVGSGGREHALGWKLAQSSEVSKVYFAPGNGGTAQVGKNVSLETHQDIIDFAKENSVNFVVIGPEQPLVEGLADKLRAEDISCFGPNRKPAQLEASKAFAAEFFSRHNIPQPESFTANSLNDALQYVEGKNPQDYVIKTSGLAAGKGVILPETSEEADKAIRDIMESKIFGDSGNQVVFQQRLHGQELSCFALTDGKSVMMLPFFQDHKQAFDGDKGPNTGGMGAYSPVPFVDEALAQRIKEEIIQPTVSGMADEGTPYQGVLYAGLFVTHEGDPKIIEYNVRFGDPECQPMMLAIKSDILPLLEATDSSRLDQLSLELNDGAVACVVLASGGYPGSYQTGATIEGLDTVDDAVVFHAGTKMLDDNLVASGGRVLNITAAGADMSQALDKAYKSIGENGVHFENMHYRTDIGKRVL